MSARIMRRILVDAARARKFQKRGGNAARVSLELALIATPDPDRDLVALDDALETLAEMDLRKSQVVEMRFFGGLSIEESRGPRCLDRYRHARLAHRESVAAA